MKVAIIGGGLAGTALAHALKRNVSNVCIYEAGEVVASGASGNELGLINPRFSAFRSPESDYFTSAFAMAQRVFADVEGVDWTSCGALHLITDEKKEKRLRQTVENWGWPEEHMRMVGAEEASGIAGIALAHESLYLPESGYISPRKLCEKYAEGVDVVTGACVESLSDIEADVIVLACGVGVLKFEEAAFLPLQSVRGQITQFKAQALSDLKVNLCYNGFCAPALDGVHTAGATFQRWLDHDDVIAEDNVENIRNLEEVLPFELGKTEVVDGRAGMRCASRDYFPVVGALPEHDNLYISCAHGSYGVLSSLASAQLLADMILGEPLSQTKKTVQALSPMRFM